MVNLQHKLLSLLSTATLLDACSAFYIEIPKRAFVAGSEQPRARRAIVLLSSRSDETTTATAPRGEARSRQRRQQPEGRSRRTHSQREGSSSGVREPRIRTTSSIPFDGKILSSQQTPNEQAPAFDLFANLENKSIRCMSDFQDGQTLIRGNVVAQPAFEFASLDDLIFSNPRGTRSDGKQQQHYKLPGFSKRFNTDAQFRLDLRQAMRQDIYDTTPQYENLSQKAKEMLLQPDSSLQGSWRKPSYIPQGEIRMKRLTQVLQDAFAVINNDKEEENKKEEDDDDDDELFRFCPTGDDFMQAIGDLCGPEPSTHYIDIVGVLDRTIPHSWHQDTGRSSSSAASNNATITNKKTVLWGFPVDSHYTGCGVFSHIVSLQHESKAPLSHPKMQPLLFDGVIDEQYIVRPSYGPGRELLMYRDIDVLHSSPDVAYRTSVMRFM